MPLCYNCKEFLPPGFVSVTDEGDNLCSFCKRESKVIVHENKTIEKSDIVRKYKEFVDKVAEKNEIIKEHKRLKGQ